ncbi:MAG: class I SAM-dependent methyltransferase [Alphaproteobacteria bacterium]
MMSVLDDPKLEALLDGLHAQSLGQDAEVDAYYATHGAGGRKLRNDVGETKAFLSDKLVALDRDKAEFCYLMCRALNATCIVEAGTSYGVSTLYLAAAVRANARASSTKGVVIGTEYEPAKAAAARANFAAAGLADLIDLREGDLRETLRDVGGAVDFMLIDIWIAMARPALELVSPRLRAGAAVVCDNTSAHPDEYQDYFAFIAAQGDRMRTMTLPFRGGLELTVRC